jgi:RNA polymerase sigma-70 factor (ECF subfamily)
MPEQSEFEDLTFCYMEQLFRLAYARVGNFDDAQDILQETYIKAYRSFRTLRQHSYSKRWLTQILMNTIHDHLRKCKRLIPTVDLEEMPENVFAAVTVGPDEEFCRGEIDPDLQKALNAIPEIFLTPLLLREIQDASYEEIAQILKIPTGTVMSRLSRARALLRKLLTDSSLSGAGSSIDRRCEIHDQGGLDQ